VTHIAPKKSNQDQDEKTQKWKPVLLPLTPGFLRLNSDRNSCEEYCDEFAVMLQNEEFLAELRYTKSRKFNIQVSLYILHQQIQPRLLVCPRQRTGSITWAKFWGTFKAHGQSIEKKVSPARQNLHFSKEKELVAEAQELKTLRARERRRIKKLNSFLV
jgi:hypothetical protein